MSTGQTTAIPYSERMFVLYGVKDGWPDAPMVWKKLHSFWFKDLDAALDYCKANTALAKKEVAVVPVTGWAALIGLAEGLLKLGCDRIVFNAVYGENVPITALDLKAFVKELHAAKDEPPGRNN